MCPDCLRNILIQIFLITWPAWRFGIVRNCWKMEPVWPMPAIIQDSGICLPLPRHFAVMCGWILQLIARNSGKEDEQAKTQCDRVMFIKQLTLRMISVHTEGFYIYNSNLLAANGLSKPFANGKSTGDSRISGARGCSHLDGTKWRNILGHAVFSADGEWRSAGRTILPIGEYRSAPFSS